MNMTEKAAYLKGLAQGLEMNEDTKEGKLLLALIDAFDGMATELSDLKEVCEELDDAVDLLDEDLSLLEEDVWGTDEEEDEDDFDDDEDLADLYEVVCPACGDHIYLDEEMLEEGEMQCPNCHSALGVEHTLQNPSDDEK